MNPSAAVVSPDSAAARGVERALEAAGWNARVHRGLERFLAAFERKRPDAVLLDLRSPGMDGRELVRALRADPKNKRVILIALTPERSSAEAVAVFSAGADEYLTLPVDADLLAARLHSLLLRAPAAPEDECYKHGAIEVRPASRMCRVSAKGVRLSRLEFELLLNFVRNPNRVFTRGWLLDQLWRGDRKRGVRAVDRHISALRAKLGGCGRSLQTLVGIGYCLSDRTAGASGSSK